MPISLQHLGQWLQSVYMAELGMYGCKYVCASKCNCSGILGYGQILSRNTRIIGGLKPLRYKLYFMIYYHFILEPSFK